MTKTNPKPPVKCFRLQIQSDFLEADVVLTEPKLNRYVRNIGRLRRKAQRHRHTNKMGGGNFKLTIRPYNPEITFTKQTGTPLWP